MSPDLNSDIDDILDNWGDISIQVLRRDNLRCVYCGLDGTKDLNAFRQLVMGFDHLVPRKIIEPVGSPENLVTCCWTCNRWKGQRDPRDLTPDGKGRDPHTPREKMIENVRSYLRSYDFEYYERARKALMERGGIQQVRQEPV
jgi:hypothetical protein